MSPPRRPRVPDGPAGVKRPGFDSGAPRSGWADQEDRAALAVPGGRRTPGSGSSWRPSRRSDIVGERWRAQSKTTSKPSIRVVRDDLATITREARETGRLPALVFGFDDGGAGREDWVAFPIGDAQALMQIAVALEAGDVDGARRAAAALR